MTNLNEVLHKLEIKIPLIQRDYAQGRTDKESTKIRGSFLNAIALALEQDSALHLDFVYGSIKKGAFIPLDGQQRLTTLFLLHWYFGKKEKASIEHLFNFSYETRASSREFCSRLVGSEIDFSADSLSAEIQDSSWFLPFWKYDPTIRSMLNVLDDIHKRFHASNHLSRLDNLTFNFFELEEFGLDDDLYIKMNARGKALTEFESFKALFEKHLAGISQELKSEFSKKIDNEWTDFFWHYAVNDGGVEVDDYILNFVFYIAEMMFYKANTQSGRIDLELEELETVFANEEQVKFLFAAFDSLKEISKACSDVFSTVDYEKGKVCLFDQSVKLLDKVIENNELNVTQSILLFMLIEQIVEEDVNPDVLDEIRVMRNLMFSVKHLKTGDISYTSDLTYENVHSLLRLRNELKGHKVYSNPSCLESVSVSGTGITKGSLKRELKKINRISNGELEKEVVFPLEDYKYLKGDLRNFISMESVVLEKASNWLRTIFSQPDSKIIRALLTIDDYTLNVGWTILGTKCFFGKKNSWDIILTTDSTDLDYTEFFKSLLQDYEDCKQQLEVMISKYIDSSNEIDWKWYFIRYAEMSQTIKNLSRDNNLYAWKYDWRIEKMGGANLNAYHLNPFVHVASKHIQGLKAEVVRFGEISHLSFEDRLTINVGEYGWKISGLSDIEIHQLEKMYPLAKQLSNDVCLLPVDGTDRIADLKRYISAIS